MATWAHKGMLVLGAVTAALLAACGSTTHPRGDEAAWVVGPDQHLSSLTTRFTVLVYRVGCGGAQDDHPDTPTITTDASTISITFRIEPEVTGPAACGTFEGLLYRVHLKQPIGERRLVDGVCRPGTTARGTGWCVHGGLRLEWRNGKPKVPRHEAF